MKYFLSILIVFLSLQLLSQERTDKSNQPVELGKVSWYRDYDEALKVATREKKAVLILFQEVPGCATCRNYGHNVLSHPLMVEAIENLFIPLTIFNNKGGKDRAVLNKYDEPSWNNPVVRVVNGVGWDVIPRVSGNYSVIGLYQAMEKSLKAQGKEIPEYMSLLKADLLTFNTSKIKEKYYKMYCFWSGEKHLGAKEGVLSAKAGFMDGYEVVKVTYDADEIEERTLNQYARQAQISEIADNGQYRYSDKDHLFYLRKSPYQYLPLTELQKTRINSALGSGTSPRKYLSPRQLHWLDHLTPQQGKLTTLIDKDIEAAWDLKAGL